jgi:hypothetical protein
VIAEEDLAVDDDGGDAEENGVSEMYHFGVVDFVVAELDHFDADIDGGSEEDLAVRDFDVFEQNSLASSRV